MKTFERTNLSIILCLLLFLSQVSVGETNEESSGSDSDIDVSIDEDTGAPTTPPKGGDDPSELNKIITEMDSYPSRGDSSKFEKREIQSSGLRYVSSWALHVRSGPSVSHRVVGIAMFGHEFKILSVENRWVKIGDKRYVHAAYLSNQKLSKPTLKPYPQ